MQKINKVGDFRGGSNTPGSFTADNEQQKKAQKARKTGNAKTKEALTQAITKSPVIKSNGATKRITAEVQEYIRTALTNPASALEATISEDDPFLLAYIKNFLKDALKSPSGKPSMLLASSMFNDRLFTTLDENIANDEEKDINYKIYKIRQTLYDRQKDVFDNSIDNNFLIINSRRTGKTELAGRIIARDLLRPISLPNGIKVQNRVAYMNRSASAAISQIEKPLMDALSAVGLRCIKGSVAGQEMEFENGSKLLIIGNNNIADLNKLRGFKFNTLIMDECSHQRNVKQLMQEVIEPTLADYGKESRLYLIGTPPRASGTFVEDTYNHAVERGWKIYHWCYIDNPFIMDRATLIDRVCKKYGVEKDSAFIRREYYGEMGVFDTDAMVFRGYKQHVITQDQIDNEVWDRVYIGVDWGFEDKAAIVVGLVKDKNMYVVYDWAQSKCATTDTMKKVKAVYDKFKTIHTKRAPMVICDTNPKENVYELSKTWKVPAYSAYKYDKDMAIDQLASWLRTATISLSKTEGSNIIDEAEKTLWKRDPETDKIMHVIDDDFFHPNSMMALLYVSRQFDNDVLLTGHSKGAKDILESMPKEKTYYEQEMEADGWETI